MFTWHKDFRVQGRECGSCQVCCIAPSIDNPDIQKMAGSPCRHSLQGGCSIYEDRPEVCRTFFAAGGGLRAFPPIGVPISPTSS